MNNARERLQQERLQTVAGIVKADLDERFADKIPFDPIVVAPATSVYGDAYFRIFVVVPDGSVLDPGMLNSASVSILNSSQGGMYISFLNGGVGLARTEGATAIQKTHAGDALTLTLSQGRGNCAFHLGFGLDKLWDMDMPEYLNLRYVDKSDWFDPEGYDGGRRGVYLGAY